MPVVVGASTPAFDDERAIEDDGVLDEDEREVEAQPEHARTATMTTPAILI